MAKITAKTPDGDRINIMETNVNPLDAVIQGKNDNPELTEWEIDGEPVKLVNSETGEIDTGEKTNDLV